ncbi:MAG: alpha/beta hydrolase [Odoribacter sp.]|nr:alpha/beta hydrolase [Odoribacter sp.]
MSTISTDILGAPFRMWHINQGRDYAGEVRCTIVNLQASCPSSRAVVYIHGFSDYFLQKEMAERFSAAGYNFYAVDLRRYGRSLLPGQHMFQVRDLSEYFPDIEAAVNAAKNGENSDIILLAHSTGGLTASLYMAKDPDPAIKALVLNSPFLEWNLPLPVRKFIIPVISTIGRFFPKMPVRQAPDEKYARSLRAGIGGEWEYREDWKPDIMPDPDAGWVRAIYRGQRMLRTLHIDVPILLMHSSRTVTKGSPQEEYSRGDAILNVKLISARGQRLGSRVTDLSVPGALHDMVLSSPLIRKEVYAMMMAWIRSVVFQ